jgi:hypothetical protein
MLSMGSPEEMFATERTHSYSLVANNPIGFYDPSGTIELVITPSIDKIGVFHDKTMEPWAAHVRALNNACFRFFGQCHNTAIIITKVEVRLFITIAPSVAKDGPGNVWKPKGINDPNSWDWVYGHEQSHMAALAAELTDIFSGEQYYKLRPLVEEIERKQHVCCEAVLNDELAGMGEKLWALVGAAFMHNWKGGNIMGPPWGEGVRPTIRRAPTVVVAREGNTPTNGIEGWFCPFDEVLVQKRPWPDWEFSPPMTTPPKEALKKRSAGARPPSP